MQISILLTTVAQKSDARRLAQVALQNRSAACIQILSGIESHYLWKGKKTTSREYLIMAKTTTGRSGFVPAPTSGRVNYGRLQGSIKKSPT